VVELGSDVSALGAWVDLALDVSWGQQPPSPFSFRVREVCHLTDGAEIALREQDIRVVGESGALPTLEEIASAVVGAMLPDEEDSGGDDPWLWFADQLASVNVVADAEELRSLGYYVLLSPEIHARFPI
jgi:hypothetical protein